MSPSPKKQSKPLIVSHRHGFTLIEILVTMSIILILAGIVIGVQRGVYRKQSESKAKGEMQAIATALESYKLKYGDYPWFQYKKEDQEALLEHLVGKRYMGVSNDTPGVLTGSKKPVMDISQLKLSGDPDTAGTYIQDPWGNPYRYYYKTDKNSTWNYPGSFILISYGPDGKTPDSATSSFTTGSLPTVKEHYEAAASTTDGRLDDIIYGLEF